MKTTEEVNQSQYVEVSQVILCKVLNHGLLDINQVMVHTIRFDVRVKYNIEPEFLAAHINQKLIDGNFAAVP